MLNHFDQIIFLFLNGLHCDWLDPVMFWGTKTIIWIPLYLLLLYLVVNQYGWKTLWIILFVAVMILVSDQLSNAFKAWTERLRPTHEPGLTGVHIVNGYLGGRYGFYSAHASSNMAIAVFLIIILRNRYRYFTPLIVSWAVFISYTRIYLGVHYPGDIIAGWIAGSLIGFCAGLFCLRLIQPRTD